jgi:hypothetical protein
MSKPTILYPSLLRGIVCLPVPQARSRNSLIYNWQKHKKPLLFLKNFKGGISYHIKRSVAPKAPKIKMKAIP